MISAILRASNYTLQTCTIVSIALDKGAASQDGSHGEPYVLSNHSPVPNSFQSSVFQKAVGLLQNALPGLSSSGGSVGSTLPPS